MEKGLSLIRPGTVSLFTKDWCPYCVKAVGLLNRLKVPFENHDIQTGWTDAQIKELNKRAGFTSVPKIFIGEECIGGCDNLHSIYGSGELYKKLDKEGVTYVKQ
eukprot:TRINITY_DN1284_c0_g1_i3.p1 TRINITY_DN1284_c0_g1~~TRINITY_DN1284_c0_g1_i3.p1  ORF type:complete len:104 (-),score=24.82 TRINITY_DN1284_c0_g1_i3:93-404(-)